MARQASGSAGAIVRAVVELIVSPSDPVEVHRVARAMAKRTIPRLLEFVEIERARHR